MLSLTIHHNIYLTKDQRYAIHRQEDVEVIGISVPVWYVNKVTSEPAKEVFCRYILKNPKKEVPVIILEDGYEISVPYREGTQLEISDEEWRTLLREDPDKLESLYRGTVQEKTSKNLLDFADGGSECLSYRELNKVKKRDQLLNIMHFINIDKIEKLTNTIS
jgi:hypothetical protein